MRSIDDIESDLVDARRTEKELEGDLEAAQEAEASEDEE